MQPIRIDDPEDPRLAPYRDIRERDLVGRQGLFVAEGKVVLDVLFSAGRFRAQSALVIASRLAGMEETFAKAPREMPIYVASPAVIDTVAGFHVHRGILAIGERGAAEDIDALLNRLPDRALIVVLVGIANHDNMGSIFRNAAAFGADAVILDGACCDPLYRKAIRVSVGAALTVPFARLAAGSDPIALLERHGFTPFAIPGDAALAERLAVHGFDQFALSPRGSSDIADVQRPRRAALYLGTEGEGLPSRLLDRLQTVRIAIAPGFDSLNVAAASAIALHRLADLRDASAG